MFGNLRGSTHDFHTYTLIFDGTETGGFEVCREVFKVEISTNFFPNHQGGVNTQNGCGFFATAMATLLGGIHIPSHEPPVEQGKEARFFPKLQAQLFDHLHIATVPIEDDEFSGTVPVEAQADLAEKLIQDIHVDIDSTGIRGQALAGTVGDGGSDENIGFLFNAFQEVVGDEGICAQRHMPAMTFDATDGDEYHQELGVSRGPVREALKRLAVEGLVDYKPNKGCTVARLSPRDANRFGKEIKDEETMQRGGMAALSHTDILEAIKRNDLEATCNFLDIHYEQTGKRVYRLFLLQGQENSALQNYS